MTLIVRRAAKLGLLRYWREQTHHRSNVRLRPQTGLMFVRPVMRHAMLPLGCLGLVELGEIREAHAESRPRVDGFELLGSLGYAAAVSEIGEDEQNPLGAFIGADFGYTWRFGFRLGMELTYGFAHEQTRKALVPVTEEVRTASAAISVGYDLVLSQFRLRGSLDMGAMPVFFGGSATAIILVAPGVGAFWEHGAFQVGVASKFIVQTNSDTSGISAELKAGARF